VMTQFSKFNGFAHKAAWNALPSDVWLSGCSCCCGCCWGSPAPTS
jgi:hypothetical protein